MGCTDEGGVIPVSVLVDASSESSDLLHGRDVVVIVDFPDFVLSLQVGFVKLFQVFVERWEVLREGGCNGEKHNDSSKLVHLQFLLFDNATIPF